MKIKRVYDRIGISNSRMPILEYLPNDSDILNLVEIWDDGPMEGHLLIQKNAENYILYEIIHHFNSKSETVYKYTFRNVDNIESIAQEFEDFCRIRYNGTMIFDFTRIVQNKEVCHFFGL